MGQKVNPYGFRLGAAAADDDARTSRVDVHADTVTGALELDACDAGAVEGLLQVLAHLDVLGHVVGVALTGLLAVGEPVRDVVRRDPETEAVRVDLLAHYLLAFLLVAATSASSGVARTTVMWLVRLLMRKARPWARGWNRFRVVPSSTKTRLT